MSDHTPGRLRLENPSFESKIIRGPQGWTEDGMLVFEAAGLAGFDYANARRLVACWNALDGIPTTDLESVAEPTSSLLRLSLLSAILREASLREARAAGAAMGAAILRERWDKIVAEDVTGDGRGHTALRGQLDALIQAAWDEDTAEPPPLNHITGSEPPC